MASVFLSYDREDADRARPLAVALEKAGHSVWWDRHIKGGAQYSNEIEEALKQADAVVVLWSRQSVQSPWVRDEAAAGRDRGRLVPVLLDDALPPMGFRQYQTVDFSRWNGRGKPAELKALLGSIDGLGVNEPTHGSDTAAKPKSVRKAPNRRLKLLSGIIVAALIALLAAFWFSPWTAKATVPIVEVAAAEPSSSANALARDLLVKLGSIQSIRPELMNLVERGRNDETPTLIFEVGGSTGGKETTASLILLNGQDRGLLWSKDFQQPSNSQADLRQQVAFTAARVLACALEGLAPNERKLRLQALKLYLNACSQLPEIAGSDSRPVIPAFLQVIRDAPRFKPAWAKLLLAERVTLKDLLSEDAVDIRARNALRQHIDAARKLDPEMAEATLAEISLLPSNAFTQAISMVDRAKQLSPDNPSVLTIRGGLLGAVGRTRESIADNKRAADLDPLSPVARNAYISALAYAGRLDSAQEELQRAEQLWPGTATLRDAQFRFHLRYGDPREALRLVQSEGGSSDGMEFFLRARIEPTPENVGRMIAHMNKRASTAGISGLDFAIQANGEFNRLDELFRDIMNWPRPEELSLITNVLFRPALRKFRLDPRFLQAAQRAGLLDYWQKSGKWPDFCTEPDLPYDCKAEAAKLVARPV